MGSAQSARRIQLGGSGRPCRGSADPLAGPPPGRTRPPPGAFPPRRCAATGSGSAWKGPRGRWLVAPASSVTAPLATTSPLPAGRGRRPLPRPPGSPPPAPAPSRGSGAVAGGHASGRAPPPPTRLSTGSDCPQCAPDRVAPPGGDRATPYRGRQGSAAMSATHPTRLETRTKESNARASQRARVETPWRNESEGRRAPAEVGSRPATRPRLPGRWSRAHHRPVSPAPSGRWSVSACDRTRKMVNYAWAGRSQRKLWWRSAAVLTCKSVVRPGYRGERLIEPSSSWFPPKFPSG